MKITQTARLFCLFLSLLCCSFVAASDKIIGQPLKFVHYSALGRSTNKWTDASFVADDETFHVESFNLVKPNSPTHPFLTVPMADVFSFETNVRYAKVKELDGNAVDGRSDKYTCTRVEWRIKDAINKSGVPRDYVVLCVPKDGEELQSFINDIGMAIGSLQMKKEYDFLDKRALSDTIHLCNYYTGIATQDVLHTKKDGKKFYMATKDHDSSVVKTYRARYEEFPGESQLAEDWKDMRILTTTGHTSVNLLSMLTTVATDSHLPVYQGVVDETKDKVYITFRPTMTFAESLADFAFLRKDVVDSYQYNHMGDSAGFAALTKVAKFIQPALFKSAARRIKQLVVHMANLAQKLAGSDKEIVLCGRSLGGLMAEMVSLHYLEKGVKHIAITDASPGARQLWNRKASAFFPGNHKPAPVYNPHVLTLASYWDVVPSLGHHTGKVCWFTDYRSALSPEVKQQCRGNEHFQVAPYLGFVGTDCFNKYHNEDVPSMYKVFKDTDAKFSCCTPDDTACSVFANHLTQQEPSRPKPNLAR